MIRWSRRLVTATAACSIAACGRIDFDAIGNSAGPGDGAVGDAAPTDASSSAFLRCDGIDDVINISLAAASRIRTLELRVRVPDAPGAPSGNTMLSADNGGSLNGAGISIDTVNPPLGLRASLAANSSSNGVSGGRAIGTDWMHVALVFDDSGATAPFDLYIDGTHDVGAGGPPSPVADFDRAQLCGGFSNVFTRVDIDWVRLSSTIRYTGTYTPPVAPSVDASTILMMDFDDLTFGDRAGASSAQVSGGPTIVP